MVGIKQVAALAAAMFALQFWQATNGGLTADEPNHILAAHFYWTAPNVFPETDLAPLLKIVTGWRASQIPPPDDPRWKAHREWIAAGAYFVDLKDPHLHDLTTAFRLPVLIFPLLTLFLIWHWARGDCGPAPALLAAAAFAFEPTALAHGSLVKNDIAAACAYAAFWYAADRRNMLLLTLATLVGILAKLSLIILAVIAPVIILTRPQRIKHLAVFAVTVYAGLCAAYQFDARVLHPVEIQHKFADPAIPYAFTWIARLFQWLPIPAGFWSGCVSLLHSSAERPPIYLNGEIFHQAQPLYFLTALAVKVPIGLLLAIAAGAIVAVRERRMFLLFPPLLYIALASLSGHQLGIRLILPALPFGALLVARLAKAHLKTATILIALAAAEDSLTASRSSISPPAAPTTASATSPTPTSIGARISQPSIPGPNPTTSKNSASPTSAATSPGVTSGIKRSAPSPRPTTTRWRKV
ncbi:MAG: hypothetical protein FJW32_12730 [Acidobacteria bacterium]|nr:hypothetical protein [Acidobacteriota bacterium]